MALARTIRVVDFETTGVTAADDVIEAGWCDLTLQPSGWRISAPAGALYGSDRITAETRSVHHISPAEVARFERFQPQGFIDAMHADRVDVVAAHHSNFEAQWLKDLTLPMVCTYKAALRVWPEAPSHGNQFLRYWLEEKGITRLNPGMTMPPHRAGPDAYATAHLLRALLTRTSLTAMVTWTSQPALLPRMPIGKQRGAPWAEIDEGFLRWMLRQDDMEADLKWNAQHELNRRGR